METETNKNNNNYEQKKWIRFKQGKRSTPNLFNILYYYFGTRSTHYLDTHQIHNAHFNRMHSIASHGEKLSRHVRDKVTQRSSWCFSILPLFLLLLMKMHFFFVSIHPLCRGEKCKSFHRIKQNSWYKKYAKEIWSSVQCPCRIHKIHIHNTCTKLMLAKANRFIVFWWTSQTPEETVHFVDIIVDIDVVK